MSSYEALLVVLVQCAVGVAGLLYIWGRVRALWSVLSAPDNVMPAQRYQEMDCPADLCRMLHLYLPLTRDLGDEFDLMDFYNLAQRAHLPCPFLVIRSLYEAERLQPLGNGIFRFSCSTS